MSEIFEFRIADKQLWLQYPSVPQVIWFCFNLHPRICLLILEREKRWCGSRERETETSTGCLPYTPWLGMKPETWLCALTKNHTHNLSEYWMMLQLTKPPIQVQSHLIFNFLFFHLFLQETSHIPWGRQSWCSNNRPNFKVLFLWMLHA